MRKKTRPLIIILTFLLAVVMPFVQVDAIAHDTYVENPHNNESFSYYHSTEVFTGYSITTGLIEDGVYDFHYCWYINSSTVGSGSGQKQASGGGVLILYDEVDTTVDISTYDVGCHDAKLKIGLKYYASGFWYWAEDIHLWSREDPPPPPLPDIEFTNPSTPNDPYDYSISTLYNCEWAVSDDDGFVATMNVYVDDVLKFEFGPQPQGDYSEEVTMNTDKTYYMKVNGTDGESNSYSGTTSVIAYNASQYVDVVLPLGQYHNSEIAFKIDSSAPDGLHNFSYTVGETGYWISNETSNNADVNMDLTWDYEYLVDPTQFVNAVDVIYGDRYESSGDYGYYKDIIITNPTATTLTNFVAYVAVTFNAKMQPDFDDVAFYSTGGGTLLDFDKAEYTASTTGHFWVEIPSFTGSGTYTTRMFYGKTGASVEDEQGTWDDNNVELVMHLDNNDDSSGNNYDFTDTGDGVSYSASQIGSGVELQGTDDYLKLPQGSSATELHNLGTSYTILSWMWCEDDTYYAQYSMTADILSLIFVPEAITDDIFRIEADAQYISKQISTSFTEDTYAHITTRVDGTDIDWFVAGALVESNVWTAVLDEADNDIFIGIEQALNNDLDGFIDELCVISEVWSDHEVEAFYEFQGDQGSWVSTGSEVSTLVLNNSITVSASYESGYDTIGSDWFINFTATDTCLVEWINITVVLYGTVFVVYSSSVNTFQRSSFTLNDTAWSSLSEGQFNVNLSLFDDLDSYFTTDLTYFKDVTAPIVTLRSPENRTASDPYSNLEIIPLSYDVKEDDAVVTWDNDLKSITIDGEMFTGDYGWSLYPKHKPLIFYEGLHTLNITAWDEAGNQDKESVSFYYEARLARPLELTFTSSLDNETIDAEQYLSIYLDGMPVDATTTTNLNEFAVTVYDKFGILLNSTSYNYTSLIDMDLTLRNVTFVNNNSIVCKYTIIYDLFEQSFWIGADSSQVYYLNDSTYRLVAEPGSTYINETHWYAAYTFIDFTVESGMSNISITLNIQDDDPMNDPLAITNYVVDVDTDLGFIYTTYTTTWGNTTIRVSDNGTWLASAQSEGMYIWTFDTTDYGMHNITIYINNSATNVFTDGFSFYLAEPEEDPNYYLTISVSVDADGGLFYVSITTSWGNQTIRVNDSGVWLGSAVGEGSSIWSFDETVYGLHNFSIYVYNGGDTWDILYTSVTIVEPESESNYYLTVHTSIDVDGGLFYTTINTYFGNCTINVLDNGVSLGDNVTEGASIWQFNEDVYGLHNFTIKVFQSDSLWDAIYSSITIVEPPAEPNYFLVVSTSVDASSGLIYVTIETYFGNCTVRVRDNSTWLGGNTSEGSSIWSFTASYGLHNFSIFVYQGNDVWTMIYTSITIMEPDVEVLAITLYEKSYDSVVSQIYINYATTWENTTCQVFDNESSLGDAVGGEGISIWTTNSAYGFHNITVIIYDDGTPWFTDIFSFTIVEPDAENNYYEALAISVDAGAGFVYTSIHTYFGNCTVRVADNETWLGGNVSEGDAIWSFDSTVYGMHNFSIHVYQGVSEWHVIYTSVTIIEPSVEELAITLYEKSYDAESGHIYINYNTNWANTTIRVMDNDTWIGSAVAGEGLSIWTTTTDYGWHNITIIIYHDGVLFFKDEFSFTLVELSAESNYYQVFSISVDADSGLLYTDILTYWGNCTIRVADNSTWLGGNMSEGNNIWSFDESVYGIHNFSIVVYQGLNIWHTFYSSVTIVEPTAESNYYLTIGTSTDAGSGLFYVTIETHFGNCTIRVKDNTTWLGANTTEGSSIWSFDQSSYGLHNFSVFIYQSNDLWNMIYTSITIVEPDVEVLALTLYDKAIDADAGLIYVNYETNWGNTTIRVMDNTTWIGSMISGEENSIWTFTTDYGLHNISVVIYNDGVPWFTDIFSFTIIVPYQIWKELTFIFTSSYDSAIIPAYDYLDIYLNDGMKYIGVVQYDVFNISVYDRFGQLLYAEVDRLYAETISINLPMRQANFTNPNSVVCYYRLSLGIYERAFWITQTQTVSYYMLDGNYTLIAEPTTLDAGDGYEYVLTAGSFEVETGMSDIEVTLDTQQIVIIYRPITVRTTSQYTSAAISEWYLKYYLDGILSMEGAATETANLTIRLVVTDVFGNILYNQSVVYARYVDIILPLRYCTFRNKEVTSTTLTIMQDGSEEHLFFVIGSLSYVRVYLADSTYTLAHVPINPDKKDGVMYLPNDYDFTCSLSSQSLDLWLGEYKDVDPQWGEPLVDVWKFVLAGIGTFNVVLLVFWIAVFIKRYPKAKEE